MAGIEPSEPHSARQRSPAVRSHPILTQAARTLLLTPLLLTGCHLAVLDPAGTIGAADKTILVDSVAIMLAIVIPTVLATFGFAWWFRASNLKAHYWPDWEYSGRLEMIVWSIPLGVIMLLGGVTWIGAHELDPAQPLDAGTAAPLNIQVVSLDWKWLFIYPDEHVASVNTLTIPAGVPIHFSLTSASVMNAFFIPRLGSMIYTMNGMTTQLNLQADHPGTFAGLSSHYSGDGFSGMHFQVHAVSPLDFAAWVEATGKSGPELTPRTYAALAVQSLDTKPFTYRFADPGLFHQIETQALPPGPGPQTGRPNPTVSPRTEK